MTGAAGNSKQADGTKQGGGGEVNDADQTSAQRSDGRSNKKTGAHQRKSKLGPGLDVPSCLTAWHPPTGCDLPSLVMIGTEQSAAGPWLAVPSLLPSTARCPSAPSVSPPRCRAALRSMSAATRPASPPPSVADMTPSRRSGRLWCWTSRHKVRPRSLRKARAADRARGALAAGRLRHGRGSAVCGVQIEGHECASCMTLQREVACTLLNSKYNHSP